MWEMHDGLHDLIASSRNRKQEGLSVSGTKGKLTSLVASLSAWDRYTFGHVRKEIRNFKKRF